MATQVAPGRNRSCYFQALLGGRGQSVPRTPRTPTLGDTPVVGYIERYGSTSMVPSPVYRGKQFLVGALHHKLQRESECRKHITRFKVVGLRWPSGLERQFSLDRGWGRGFESRSWLIFSTNGINVKTSWGKYELNKQNLVSQMTKMLNESFHAFKIKCKQLLL